MNQRLARILGAVLAVAGVLFACALMASLLWLVIREVTTDQVWRCAPPTWVATPGAPTGSGAWVQTSCSWTRE